VVVCPERCADLHTAQLMPVPLTASCFSKIQLVLPLWCRLTLVVSEKRPLKRVCVCVVYLYEINAKLQVVATNKLDHKPSESPCSKYRNEIPSRRPQHRRLHGSRLGVVCLFIYLLITPPPMGERSIAMSVSVCLCVCLSAIISSELHVRSSPNFFVHVAYGRGSVLLWRRSYVLPVLWIPDG